MATTSTRETTIVYSGDVVGTQTLSAASNVASPGQMTLINLSSGANNITPPASAVAVTIKPPSSNTVLITLKGVTGDIGIPLHKTDPTTVALDTTFTTLCLTAASAITGLRLYWS